MKMIMNDLYKIQIINDENDIKKIKDYWNDYLGFENKISVLLNKLKDLKRTEKIDNVSFWIYESNEPNAFAYWCWFCWWYSIAFSTAILNLMTPEELLWVLWHEFSHIKNNDVVAMTILEWFANTIVIYLSRIIANIISNNDEDDNEWFIHFILVFILEILFWLLTSIWLAYYSRIREYKADEWSAKLLWKEKMIEALKKLLFFENQWLIWIDNREAAASFKIDSNNKLLSLFSTHPPLNERIEKLENL